MNQRATSVVETINNISMTQDVNLYALYKDINPGVYMYVNGAKVIYPDVQPRYTDNMIVTPLRFVLTDMGAKVYWDGVDKAYIQLTETINGTPRNVEHIYQNGSSTVKINGVDKTLITPAVIENGRFLIPASELIRGYQTWYYSEDVVNLDVKIGYIWDTPELGVESKYNDLPDDYIFTDISSYTEITPDSEKLIIGGLKTVKYDLNGGNGLTPASADYGITDKITVSEGAGVSRPDATFKGWSTNPLAISADYFPLQGNIDVMTLIPDPLTEVTLYAVWEYDSLIYDSNGATSGIVPREQGVLQGTDNIIIKGNPGGLVKTGYYFGGWTKVQNKNIYSS